MEVVDFTLADGQARVQIGAVGLHPAHRVCGAVPDDEHAVFAARRSIAQRANLAIVEALVSHDQSWNLPNLNQRHLLGIPLNLENVDGMGNASTVGVADVHAITRNPEATAITDAVEVAAAPGSSCWIANRWHSDHPVQAHEVAEEVKLLFE